MAIIAHLPQRSNLRQRIYQAYYQDETQVITELLNNIDIDKTLHQTIEKKAYDLVKKVRSTKQTDIDAFLQEFELNTKEGVVLMCLAEALLRVPDSITIDKLIADKLTNADWQKHLGSSQSLFVNASTWALILTGKVVKVDTEGEIPGSVLKNMFNRLGTPVIRQAVVQSMRILGRQFVLGRTIDEALQRANELEKKGYAYSYDMLGESARTDEDALRYFESYRNAIKVIKQRKQDKDLYQAPGISVKLSALYARYELHQYDRVFAILIPRILQLAVDAKDANIGLTIDAEEADRLDISLDIIEYLAGHESLASWQGLGLALQAYQKRAFWVIDWLLGVAKKTNRRFMLRLVKGAYWDSEIKWSQQKGCDDYPVFTRKASTDVSYIACAQKILRHLDCFYPQFATHNAHTLATLLILSEPLNTPLEFQRLHGMGDALYQQLPVGKGHLCRIYAPVGSHEDLLAYLVRRLLENGANTSFVNRIQDASLPIERIVKNPIAKIRNLDFKPHPKIVTPPNLYKERKNSKALDLTDPIIIEKLDEDLDQFIKKTWHAGPIVDGQMIDVGEQAVYSPQNQQHLVGYVADANEEQVRQALLVAKTGFIKWNKQTVTQRAACLDALAQLLEQHYNELLALCVLEAGKTLPDAVAEVREAVDFCRYYALMARTLEAPMELVGPTGEYNGLSFTGRGTFVCISPWNFPLAIFLGQITAALVMGNSVIAKPAEQTPLIGAFAVQLMLQAGVPKEVIQFLPGPGETVGALLVNDPSIHGVAFTGSTDTARLINQSLAGKKGAITPLIAETGGQNVLIADSTAVPEQLIHDVIESAFQSAGQRCSALRVLFVPEQVADKVIRMLRGAMLQLQVEDPIKLCCDVGPVIDEGAKAMLDQHIKNMTESATLIAQTPLEDSIASRGHYVTPTAFEIDNIAQLEKEVFGPVLHVIRYKNQDLNNILQAVTDSGYGLTLGIHSRIDGTVKKIAQFARVGNIYVNRNMIGATVGVQPFGGQGLSGTGPKAGGPYYLHRFANEKTITIDTTSSGGNASLLSLSELD